MIRYTQGAVLMVLTGTLLTSLYTTPSYQDHYRNIWWVISSLCFATLFALITPYLKNQTFVPFITGVISGAILTLVIDNFNKGVENYWMIGSLYTCLPDFIIWIGMPFLFIVVTAEVLRRYKHGKQALKEA